MRKAARYRATVAAIGLAVLAFVLGALSPATAAGSGSELWARRFDGPAHGNDVASGVTVSPNDSTVYVTGYSAGSTLDDYATIAYSSSTGGKTWHAPYDGSASGDDRASSIAVGPGGLKVFVTGSSEGGSTAKDYATTMAEVRER